MVDYNKYSSPEAQAQADKEFDELMKGLTASPETIIKKNDVKRLALNILNEFQNHPFKVKRSENDVDFEELKQSIKENGVGTPIIVRPKGNQYEIISGHRRTQACRELDIDTVPAVIMNIDDDEATTLMVELNKQRPDWLPSEKAFAYKMKMEAMKRKAGRPQKNSAQFGPNFLSAEKVADDVGESRNQIKRFIRLTNLIPALLQKVDDNDIPVNSGYRLSFLDVSEQNLLLDFLKEEKIKKINLNQAVQIDELSADKNNGKSLIAKQTLLQIFGLGSADKSYGFKLNLYIPKKTLAKAAKDENLTAEIEELIRQWAIQKGLEIE